MHSPVQAIVVLGCRVGPDHTLPGPAARRVARAARAYHDGVAPLVVAAGGKRWNGLAEAEAFCKALAASGVPESAMIQELGSLTTRENAWCTARLLGKSGHRRVAVVTCDWHLRRALMCFHATGLEAVGVPAATPAGSPRLVNELREVVSHWFDERAARYGS